VVRTRIAPHVLPHVFALDAVRSFLFRRVSQIALGYRDSPLSEGSAGQVHGGDRLPWAPVPAADNFDTLRTPAWQVHVYGQAAPALAAWCREHTLPLHAFAWHARHAQAGLQRDALYLLRPDAYVALAVPDAQPEALAHYAQARGLRLRGGAQ